MYWRIESIRDETELPVGEDAGRFVLHRHRDAGGAHLDLRLESGGCLTGFRVARETLEPEAWATEKMPHPLRWLDDNGDAQREDAGRYHWRDCGENHRELTLAGEHGARTVRFERVHALPVETLRALAELSHAHHLDGADMAGLVEDGLTARRRAVARFCGLSRALDGDGFDEAGWRALLSDMSLREIGERLAAVEIRHDRAHPPAPLSRPEPLDGDDGAAARRRHAFHIAREQDAR